MKLDIEYVRRQFPAFKEEALKNQAFFENAGGSYTCKPVIDRLFRYYHQRKVQPYHPFEAALLAGDEMDDARARLANMMGVEYDELSFGPSTTQNTYVLAQAFRQHLKTGDAIIVTNQDHEANTGPWRRLADDGLDIREWKIDPDTGHLDIADLKNLLDEKVKLVCFPHCSNVVGEINPVAEICKLARDNGSYSCVDGVSYAPHGFVNVDDIGADIYLFSAYKTYGPHQGIMVIRRDLGMVLPNQGHYFNADCLYKRFTPAGPDHAQVAACAGMADYVDDLYAHHFSAKATAVQRAAKMRQLVAEAETGLMQPLLDYFSDKNSTRLLGPRDAQNRAPTIAVELAGNAGAVAQELATHGIMAGGADFYAVRALEAQGIDPAKGVLRVSFVHYTNQAEIDKLIAALDQTL